MKTASYPVQKLRRRTLVWALKLRVNPKIVRIQSMRHKWGSCSSKGVVTLAIDLADQEEDFQEFVIAHELLHLRVPNHGRLFKALLTAYVPNWRQLHSTRVASRSITAATPPTARRRLSA